MVIKVIQFVMKLLAIDEFVQNVKCLLRVLKAQAAALVSPFGVIARIQLKCRLSVAFLLHGGRQSKIVNHHKDGLIVLFPDLLGDALCKDIRSRVYKVSVGLIIARNDQAALLAFGRDL